MKSFVSKYKYWLIGLVVVVGIYQFFFRTSTSVVQPTYADTVAVESGSIISTLQVLGTTKLVSSQTLTFGAAGKVTKVNVKQGDKVKKGQVLAEIDNRSASNDVAAQQIAVSNAQINYDKLYQTPLASDVTQIQNQIAQSNATISTTTIVLANLEQERANKIKEQEDNIKEIKRQLTLLDNQGTGASIDDYNTQAAEIGNTALDSIQQLRSAVITLKGVFSTENLANPSRTYIGAKAGGSLDNVDVAISQLQAAIPALQAAYDTFITTNPQTAASILALQKANQVALQVFINSAQVASVTIANSVIDTRNYPQSQLNSDQSTVSSMNSKALSLLASITNAIKTSQSNTTSRLTLQNNLDSANRSLNELRSSYALQIQQKQNDIDSNNLSIQLNNEKLDNLQGGPRALDKAAAQNQISQASINLSKSQQKLDDYKLIAQFDGVVTSVNIKVGDQVTTSYATSAGITVEVPGIYEIDLSLDQLDIVKISLGEPVNIVFDAYPDEILTGTISEIDPTPTTTQGVVSYAAKIILKKEDRVIYNSMSATVNIILAQHDNVVVVPTLAVSGSGDIKTVQVRNNGKVSTRTIQTGITNGKRVEIVSGLEVGERILTKQFKVTKQAAFSIFGASRPSGAAGGQRGPNAPTSDSAQAGGSQPPSGGPSQ